MGFLKNRDKQTIAELESYYAGKNNSGMAWVMAFLSLLITVSVLSGIFFGGRWGYRTITNDIDDTTTSTTVTDKDTGNSGGDLAVTTPSTSSDTDNEFGVDSEGSAQESAIVGGSLSTGGVVSDEAASTSIPNQDVASSTDSNEIPNTGAGNILLLVPILVVVLGYAFSIKYQLQQL